MLGTSIDPVKCKKKTARNVIELKYLTTCATNFFVMCLIGYGDMSVIRLVLNRLHVMIILIQRTILLRSHLIM